MGSRNCISHRWLECCSREAEAIYCLVMGCELNTPITCARCRVRQKRRATKSWCPHQCATPWHPANGELQIHELLDFLYHFFFLLLTYKDWVVMLKRKPREAPRFMACYVAEPEFIYLALSDSLNIRTHPFSIINIHGKSIRLCTTYTHLLAFYKGTLFT